MRSATYESSFLYKLVIHKFLIGGMQLLTILMAILIPFIAAIFIPFIYKYIPRINIGWFVLVVPILLFIGLVQLRPLCCHW